MTCKFYFLRTFFCAFLFCFSFVNAQESKLIDSLKLRLHDKIDNNLRIKIYGDLIWSYKERSIDSSLNYINKALKSINSSSDLKLTSQLYSDIAGVYMLNGNFEACQKMYWKSLRIRTQTKDSLGIAKIKANLAAVYTKYDRLDSAMIYGIEAMKVFESKGYIHYSNVIKSNVATIFESLKNYQKALTYNLEVVRYSEKSKNDNFSAKLYNNIASNYFYLKDNINAEKYYLKAIHMAKKVKNFHSLGASLNNLSGIYFERKEIEKGIKTAKEALKYREYFNSKIDIADLYFALGRENFNLYNFKKANDYFKKSEKVYEKSKNLNRLADTYNYLSILAAKSNNNKEAVRYKNLSIAISEQYMTSMNTKEITELETKYETEKKEKELLQIQSDKIVAELELSNQKQITYGLIGGVLLLLLLGFSIVQQNKRKYQLAIANQKQQNLKSIIKAEEKERTRIARELHDGIVQQIGATILKSRNTFKTLGISDETGTLELLNDLEASSKELRSISHRMMPRALEEKGLIIALDELLVNNLKTSQIEYSFEHTNIENRIPKNIEVILYRITQELIQNIIKHSQATEVSIQLMKMKNQILYLVEDNGVGFQTKKTTGIGLNNILSRVDLVQGSANFDSQTTGTLTTIKIPL